MLSFISRRLAATLAVLLVASFFVYMLTANSGDPLQDLRLNKDPQSVAKMATLTEKLDLNTPPLFRYFKWIGGAASCVIGQCNLGISVSRGDEPVANALANAMESTLSLVILATVLSILFGVAIGMTTALRQYSGYDYTVTFAAFIFYSLPIFWVAVLLKEFGAIRFNEFLGNPVIPWWAAVSIGLVLAFIVSSVVGGRLVSRLRTAGITLALVATVLVLADLTQWFAKPSIGIVGVALLTAAIGSLMLFITSSVKRRPIVLAVAATGVVVVALWYPLQFLWFYVNTPLTILIVAVALAAVGALAGFLLGGDDRRDAMRTAALSGAISTLPLVLDQMFMRWSDYIQLIPLRSGAISTIGATTPTLTNHPDTWLRMLDSGTHIILPTAALMIISIAGYTRYTRASLLEVLNQDYVRTARAKGLPETTVIMRHAFRNALIPIATIVAFDFGSVIGGAIITERVFAWQGMGALFGWGLYHVDVNLVMGVFLVTGVAAVVFNIFADLAYSALDPRIRVTDG
jgi:peptide/nickel transport system permease protein